MNRSTDFSHGHSYVFVPKLNHVPSFVMSASAVQGATEGALLRTTAHSFLQYFVLLVSVFSDGKGLSNNDGQMSQFIQLVSLVTK